MSVALFIIIIAAALSIGALLGKWHERYIQSLDDDAARFMAASNRAEAICDQADMSITGDEREEQL